MTNLNFREETLRNVEYSDLSIILNKIITALPGIDSPKVELEHFEEIEEFLIDQFESIAGTAEYVPLTEEQLMELQLKQLINQKLDECKFNGGNTKELLLKMIASIE